MHTPFRIAGIDIGSNAIRYVSAAFTSPVSYSVIESERYPVRLGHDVFLSGAMERTAMDRAVEVLQNAAGRIKRDGISHFRCVATSAVRDSRNGSSLVEEIKKKSGIEVTIISGSEEARLVHLAVRRRINLGEKQWLLVDIGGGSVEVSLCDSGGVLWSESHTMGTIRLLEELSLSSEEPGRFNRLLTEYVSTLRIPSAARHRKPSGLVATGGNIEELATLTGAATGEGGVRVIKAVSLRAAIKTLWGMSFRERVEKFKLRPDRADVILPAAVVYERIARMTGAKEILAPGVGVKEGILYDIADELMSGRGHRKHVEDAVLSAATNLGRRYLFDEAHGAHVQRLALSLFDQASALHGLGHGERRMLMAAALLHDVGSFISFKGHHKHSLYILSQSELPGFTDGEMLIVANIARYHRKSAPKERHELFMKLSLREREIVIKLAAILRIADALDREHNQHVREVVLGRQGPVVTVHYRGKGDFTLVNWALKKNLRVFEDAFRVTVALPPY
ncbi:MAG: Ppx/GppA family phosphatase [Spirochaetes bacterium]|nr:MAG: Ppx/GppA family phosphatase [Spirochaetota bacterium]